MAQFETIDNIKAKTFFEILKTKDYSLLVATKKNEDLEKVFMDIYNDFFVKSANPNAQSFLDAQNVIIVNEYKISILKQSLSFFYYQKTTEQMRQDFILALKTGFGIEINQELPFEDEVLRVLNTELGYLENEISIAKGELKGIQGTGTAEFDFYETIIGFGNILPGNTLISPEMSLSMYIAMEKSARKQIEQLNKKKS